MYVVTGATGHLGRLIIDAMLARGVDAGDIAAIVRDPAKAVDLAARGIDIRRADYDDPDALSTALRGSEDLMFVSGSEVGKRVPQHRRVVDAAVSAEVGRVVYTSILRADTSGIGLAQEHKPTEDIIRTSGLPYTIMRNGWYLENYTENLGPPLATGRQLGCAGDGRIAAAARADYAAAAAEVLLTSGHLGAIYELAGDEAFTMADFAAELSRASRKQVVYRDLPEREYVRLLIASGVSEALARMLADWDAAVARGDLDSSSRDLSRLIDRPSTSLASALATALA